MSRPTAVTSIATLFSLFLAGSSCQGLLGGVDVIPAAHTPAQGSGSSVGGAPAARPVDLLPLPTSRVEPEAFPIGSIELGGGLPPPDETASSVDAGRVRVALDAGRPSPPLPRPIVVEGAVSELAQVGADGGEPHLGTCPGGVIIGVAPTANPSEDVFGQRLTQIAPICGKAVQQPAADLGGASLITVVRDDSLLSWDDTPPFQGPPPTEVPDTRLIWMAQPAELCPEAAPVLVGLSGEYDPVAPDVGVTAAIRSLVIECAPLVVAPNGLDVGAAVSGHVFIARADGFGAAGAAVYDSFCQEGSVVSAILVHAGYWLDGFSLGCSSLNSPRLAEEP